MHFVPTSTATTHHPPPCLPVLFLAVNHGKFPKQDDSYAFEEDSSSESLSPEQHHSDESQGSACPSSEAVGSTPSSSSPALTSPRQVNTKLPTVRYQTHRLFGLRAGHPPPLSLLWFFCPPVVAKGTAQLPRAKTIGTHLNPGGCFRLGAGGDSCTWASSPSHLYLAASNCRHHE